MRRRPAHSVPGSNPGVPGKPDEAAKWRKVMAIAQIRCQTSRQPLTTAPESSMLKNYCIKGCAMNAILRRELITLLRTKRAVAVQLGLALAFALLIGLR